MLPPQSQGWAKLSPRGSSQHAPVWCLLLCPSTPRLLLHLGGRKAELGKGCRAGQGGRTCWGFSPSLSAAGLVWGAVITPGAGMCQSTEGKAAAPRGRQGLGKGEPVDGSWAVEAPGASPAARWGLGGHRDSSAELCVCVSPPVLQS